MTNRQTWGTIRKLRPLLSRPAEPASEAPEAGDDSDDDAQSRRKDLPPDSLLALATPGPLPAEGDEPAADTEEASPAESKLNEMRWSLELRLKRRSIRRLCEKRSAWPTTVLTMVTRRLPMAPGAERAWLDGFAR